MASSMTVAVSGASGHLGRKVADLLLECLEPSQVILLTRTPEALSSYAERGAVVRFADFDDPATLVEAVSGAGRLLLISALDFERRVGQHRAAIQAAKAAGVGHVIYTSIPEPEGNPAAAAPSHLATEVAARDGSSSPGEKDPRIVVEQRGRDGRPPRRRRPGCVEAAGAQQLCGGFEVAGAAERADRVRREPALRQRASRLREIAGVLELGVHGEF